VAAHLLHARSRKSKKLGGSGTTPSPLPFCTGGEKQHHLQIQENATSSGFYFIFSFSNLLPVFFLSDLFLL
jgi:hypothetical protein